jgi:hypothetical protein
MNAAAVYEVLGTAHAKCQPVTACTVSNSTKTRCGDRRHGIQHPHTITCHNLWRLAGLVLQPAGRNTTLIL